MLVVIKKFRKQKISVAKHLKGPPYAECLNDKMVIRPYWLHHNNGRYDLKVFTKKYSILPHDH